MNQLITERRGDEDADLCYTGDDNNDDVAVCSYEFVSNLESLLLLRFDMTWRGWWPRKSPISIVSPEKTSLLHQPNYTYNLTLNWHDLISSSSCRDQWLFNCECD